MVSRIPAFASLASASLLLGAIAGTPALGQSALVGWGWGAFDSRLSDDVFVEASAGVQHVIARRADGSIAAWGVDFYQQSRVPHLPAGLTYTRAWGAGDTNAALRSDG